MIRLAAVCMLLVGCADAPPITVFAAASTTDVVEAVTDTHPDAESIAVSVAASSTLARQIAAGAPAHVFVSADRQWVDWLIAQGVSVRRQQTVATGRLVVVGRTGDRPGSAFVGRVALADPSHVPAGRYARLSLRRLRQWDTVQASAVYVADVRAALVAVEAGAADRAIVYASDVEGTSGVDVVYRFPDMPEIQFVVAELGENGAVYDSLARAAPWRAAGFGWPP